MLLLSDLDSRIRTAPKDGAPAKPARLPRVAVVQHNTQPVFDAGVQGMIDGLAESGFRDGTTLNLRRFNPLGDTNLANAIAREVTDAGYDLILTATTPSVQTVGNANRSRHVPHVFALVADPTAVGLGIQSFDSLDHPAHLTGYGTRLPVTNAFHLARQLNPSLKTVGTLWNTAEVNSEIQIHDARKVCAELGITLVEVNVDGTGAVSEAAAAVCSRNIEALFIPGDVTVLSAVNNVIQVAQRSGLPVFSLFPSAIPKGELFNVGADYYAVGHRAGLLAGEVLHGRSPATIPVVNFVPEKLALNSQVLASLRNKTDWSFPQEILDKAVILVDANGKVTDRSPAKTSAPLPAATAVTKVSAPLPPKTIALAYFAPEPSWQDCRNGLLNELRTLGYEEGKNLTVRSAHTQGEASNIPSILLNYEASDADALVTFSTPMLQGALAAIKHKPVVFTYVTDPLAAGAGKSWTDHDPRFTGVGTMVPVADGVRVLRALFPNLKRLGTLYNAGEVNSTRVIDLLGPACDAAGIQLEKVSIATTSDAIQAAQALVSRRVEAIYIPNDNLVYQAYPGLIQTFTRAKLPVMNGDPAYLGKGVLASVGPGYYAAGQAAAHKLARVLGGEKPATIPMENVSTNRIGFDRDVAAKLGLTFDEALLKSLETPAPTATPSSPAPTPTPAAIKPLATSPFDRPRSIEVIYYNETAPAEETIAGIKERLAQGPFVEGRDFTLRFRNAQGDMSVLNSLYDAALTARADLVIALSTPSLQVAVSKLRNGRTPLVFGMVANPVAAGAGKTYEDHLPFVTGISVRAPAPQMADLLQTYFPQFKRVGTLFCPSETNSVDLRDYMTKVCAEHGITLEAVAVNSPTELVDAAQSLAGRRIDAIVQISDNITSAGFTAVARAARSARKPLISMNSTTIPQGSGLSMGHDYHEAGLATADYVIRVLQGESPGSIPFLQAPKINLTAHLPNAQATGLEIPEALLSKCKPLIRN